MRVIVTGTKHDNLCAYPTLILLSLGASGVLGSAIYAAYKAAGHTVLGLANSRPTEELKKLDLLDSAAVEETFGEFKPDCQHSVCSRSRDF